MSVAFGGAVITPGAEYPVFRLDAIDYPLIVHAFDLYRDDDGGARLMWAVRQDQSDFDGSFSKFPTVGTEYGDPVSAVLSLGTTTQGLPHPHYVQMLTESYHPSAFIPPVRVPKGGSLVGWLGYGSAGACCGVRFEELR